MTKLPKNFPEYSIMYKTLIKKINELKSMEKDELDQTQSDEIRQKINKFQAEAEKIRDMFPEKFFDEKS